MQDAGICGGIGWSLTTLSRLRRQLLPSGAKCFEQLGNVVTVEVAAHVDGGTVAIGAAEYPKDIIAEYKNKVENTYVIDAFGIAESLGNAKCMNIALLGALAKRLGLDGTDWERLIREEVPRKAEELNISAFKRGFEMG